MKNVRPMRILEQTPYIPVNDRWFVDVGELGDKIQINSFTGGEFVDFLWRFKSHDYGVCYGQTNPLSVVTLGFFKIHIRQANGLPFDGYCADMRVIATLQSVINGKREGRNPLTGEFAILDEAEAKNVYAENAIPKFTLI